MPSLSYATSLNYLEMKVISLVFDLMAGDTANFFAHLSIGGAESMWLDWIGNFYGVRRITGELDRYYKTRLLRTLAEPKENNVAIAQQVSEAFSVPDVLVTNYKLFWCILYVFGTLANPRSVLPFAKSIAPAGIKWTGLAIPPGGNLSGAVCGRVRCGNNIEREGAGWLDSVSLPLGGIFEILR